MPAVHLNQLLQHVVVPLQVDVQQEELHGLVPHLRGKHWNMLRLLDSKERWRKVVNCTITMNKHGNNVSPRNLGRDTSASVPRPSRGRPSQGGRRLCSASPCSAASLPCRPEHTQALGCRWGSCGASTSPPCPSPPPWAATTCLSWPSSSPPRWWQSFSLDLWSSSLKRCLALAECSTKLKISLKWTTDQTSSLSLFKQKWLKDKLTIPLKTENFNSCNWYLLYQAFLFILLIFDSKIPKKNLLNLSKLLIVTCLRCEESVTMSTGQVQAPTQKWLTVKDLVIGNIFGTNIFF